MIAYNLSSGSAIPTRIPLDDEMVKRKEVFDSIIRTEANSNFSLSLWTTHLFYFDEMMMMRMMMSTSSGNQVIR